MRPSARPRDVVGVEAVIDKDLASELLAEKSGPTCSPWPTPATGPGSARRS